jgi:hypothetical protein
MVRAFQDTGNGTAAPATFTGQVKANGESPTDNKTYSATYRVTRYWGVAFIQAEAVAYFHTKADADAAAATLNATAHGEVYRSEVSQ